MMALGLALGLSYGDAPPLASNHWLFEAGYAIQWEAGIYATTE